MTSVGAYLRRFRNVGGTVTFNLLCYQNGSADEGDLQLMRRLKKRMRGSQK